MAPVPPQLARAFQKQDYDTALSIAQQFEQPLKSKVICTIHIKNQDFEALEAFLNQEETAVHAQDLLFFKAYADYVAKRDAQWFLSVRGSHPKEDALKQQILYRLQRYDQAQHFGVAQLHETRNFEQTINNLAIAVRSGADYTPRVQFENFEFWYNRCLHSAQQCKFNEAFACLANARKLAAEDPDSVSEKDLEQLVVLEIILLKYSKNENKTYMLDDFKTPACKSLLEVFKLFTSISFAPSPRFIENARFNLLQLQNDLQIVKYRCDASVLPQLDLVATIVARMLGTKTHAKRCINCNQMMRRSYEFASLVQLPQIQPQRKNKKAVEQEVQYNAVAAAIAQPFKKLRCAYNDEQRQYFARFYTTFGMLPTCAQLGVLPACSLLQVQDYSITRLAVQNLPVHSTDPSDIRAEIVKVKSDPRPMPLKWQKKKKRGANAGKHQGAEVKGREEVSKVKTQPPQYKNRRGGRKK